MSTIIAHALAATRTMLDIIGTAAGRGHHLADRPALIFFYLYLASVLIAGALSLT